MNTYILTMLILLVPIILIRAVNKNENKGESKLSVFEHPSTFKKPDIEMVAELPKENKTEAEYLR